MKKLLLTLFALSIMAIGGDIEDAQNAINAKEYEKALHILKKAMGGFLSGFAGSLLGGFVKGLDYAKTTAGTIMKVTMTAIAGGTASVLGGGKFANGAMSAAFVFMFNHLQAVKGTPEEQAKIMQEKFGYTQDPNAKALVSSLGTNAENWYNRDAPIANFIMKASEYTFFVGFGLRRLALELYDTAEVGISSFIAGAVVGTGAGAISASSGIDPLEYTDIKEQVSSQLGTIEDK